MEGLVGVAVGLLAMFPMLVVFRALWLGAFPAAGEGLQEYVFLGVVGATTDVTVFGPLFLILGFLGGTLVDRVRPGPGHAIRRPEREP